MVLSRTAGSVIFLNKIPKDSMDLSVYSPFDILKLRKQRENDGTCAVYGFMP